MRIAQIDLRAEQIGRRVSVDLGVVGDVKATLQDSGVWLRGEARCCDLTGTNAIPLMANFAAERHTG